MADPVESEFMDVYAVAEWTGIPAGTLRYWRTEGARRKGAHQGPPSALFGRRIVYRTADVREWIEKQFEASA